jgi:hypothetical protein
MALMLTNFSALKDGAIESAGPVGLGGSPQAS